MMKLIRRIRRELAFRRLARGINRARRRIGLEPVRNDYLLRMLMR